MTTLLGGYDLNGDRAYDAAVAAAINVCHRDAIWRQDDTRANRGGERCLYCGRLMPIGRVQECHGDQTDS